MQMAGCPLWGCVGATEKHLKGSHLKWCSHLQHQVAFLVSLPRCPFSALILFSSLTSYISQRHFACLLSAFIFFFNLFCWSSNEKWHMFKKAVWCQLVFTHNQPAEHCRRATLLALVYLKGVLALVFVEKTPEKVNSQRPPSVGKIPEITEGDEDCSTC